MFNQYFCNIGPDLAASIPNSSDDFLSYLSPGPQKSIFLEPTSEGEVAIILSEMKSSKAVGPDLIPTHFLKLVFNIIGDVICIFFNESIRLGIFPDALKTARVMPVFKKGCKKLISNYRPISVLPNLATVFEKLIDCRLKKFFELNAVLSPTQHGFRSNHNTNHAILSIVTDYYKTIKQKESGCSIFIDLRKAFDTVNHRILRYKLEHYGIRGIAATLLESYLANRKQFVKLGTLRTTTRDITCGVPQGSVLGPTFFLIYINDIVNASLFRTTLFADDTHLFITSNTVDDLHASVNRELPKVSRWLQANKLSLNADKTEMLVLNNASHNFTVNINHKQISICDSAKYLGVTIDSKLSWKQHIECTISKLARCVGIMTRLQSLVSRSVLRTIYFSLFHSHLQYGIVVWGNACTTFLCRIRTLQNRAIRLISSVPLRTNLSPYYRKHRILRVDELYRFEVSKVVHKYFSNSLPPVFDDFFIPAKHVHSHYTRSSSKGNIYLPPPNSNLTKRSIDYSGPIIWNALPPHIRELPYNRFKKALLDHLLSLH